MIGSALAALAAIGWFKLAVPAAKMLELSDELHPPEYDASDPTMSADLARLMAATGESVAPAAVPEKITASPSIR